MTLPEGVARAKQAASDITSWAKAHPVESIIAVSVFLVFLMALLR